MKPIVINITLAMAAAVCPAVSWSQNVEIHKGENITYSLKGKAEPVVGTALEILEKDASLVLGSTLKKTKTSGSLINIRTLGKNDRDPLAGRKQAFRLDVKEGKLNITGSDAHGTAYGILEVSRLLGVSPWVWWADSKPAPMDSLVIAESYVNEQQPAVEYRGIFINDEDLGFAPWAWKTNEKKTKGYIGPKTHSEVFELLLRLRANVFWPAMHGSSNPFYFTEGNKETATKYGITIGTSHCEPMMRNTNGEWKKAGKGEYDYVANRDGVKAFWEERVKDVAGTPCYYTLGMRGIHDTGMVGAETMDQKVSVMQQILKDQREMLVRYNKGTDITAIPQVFIPYKEVLDIYRAGLKVPEDVTLMWTDDNYGYMHYYPSAEEQARPGGNGMYYHISYSGRPHRYIWLASTSPSLMQTEMERAWNNNIRKIWVLNVGDIKPCEYLTEYYLDMAWNKDVMLERDTNKHLLAWLEREFGKESAPDLLDLFNQYYALSWECKPEYLDNVRYEEPDDEFRTPKDMPWGDKYVKERLARTEAIEAKLAEISKKISPDKRDSFFELVEYTLGSFGAVHRKMLGAQLARHKTGTWDYALRGQADMKALIARYDSIQDGKWERMLTPQRNPRSVFTELDTTMRSFPIPQPRYKVWTINPSDGTFGTKSYMVPRLGYSGEALSLAKNDTFCAVIPAYPEQSQEVILTFVPNHACGTDRLEVKVEIDGEHPVFYNIDTYHRSEEWKQNVLTNKAQRTISIPPSDKPRNIKITATTPAVLLDRIIVRADYPLF